MPKNCIILVIFLFCTGFANVSFAKVYGTNGNIIVTDALVRYPRPSVPTSVAYMSLFNKSYKADKLISASAPNNVCRYVELHNMTYKAGMMRMRKVESIVIPGKKNKVNGKTVLKPGGFHIMLIGLNEEALLKAGTKVKLKLNFEYSKSITILVPVKKVLI